MCGTYTTRKRTLRWPNRVFQHMMDVSAFNVFVLWREVTGKQNIKRRQFVKMLGAELCGGSVDESGNVNHDYLEAAAIAKPFLKGAGLRCRQCEPVKTVQRCKKCEKPLSIVHRTHAQNYNALMLHTLY